MFKQLHFKTMLLLGLMLAGVSSAWAEDQWVLVEDYSTLSTTDTYVIAGNIKGGSTWYALKNSQVTTATNLPCGSTLTISNKKITSTVASTDTWVLETTATDGVYYIKSTAGAYYLQNAGATGSKIASKSSTDNENQWRIHYAQGTEANTVTGLYNVGKSRELGCYNATTWRCYASTNYANLAGAEVVLYKKETIASFELTAISNNDTYGTVSTDGNVITATAKDGYRISISDPYTITVGSATVNQSGNVFTVTASEDCTVRINFEAIPSHTLAYAVTPVGAGTVTLSTTSVQEEATATATASANAGYKFKAWSISGTGASLSSSTENPTEVTMGTADATVTAEFEAVSTHAITWSVNGVATTENVEEGADIIFAAPATAIPAGYEFVGWTATSLAAPQNDAPAFVTSATCTTDMTYYAVMAIQVSSTPESWSKVELSALTASDIFVFANGDYAMTNDGGTSIAPTPSAITVSDNKITSAVADNLKWNVSGNAEDGYTFYPNGSTTTWLYCNTTAKSGSNNNIRVGTGARKVWVFDDDGYLVTNDANVDRYLSMYETQDFRGYINTDNAFVPNFYKYIAPTAIYEDYCTALPTATVTLASACTDGTKYFGTYSNSSAFIVPADLTVSEISVIDGELLVENYATGDVVPANTGVMIASATAGEHTVTLSKETGSSVLGSDNMLKASSVAMTGDCKFYRLTMHNGETIGFWWGAAEGAAFDIAANKAYLAVPNTAGARAGFALFGDNVTAIEGVTSVTDGEAVVYNLQGQRVNTNVKGIVIKNGKKFINK